MDTEKENGHGPKMTFSMKTDIQAREITACKVLLLYIIFMYYRLFIPSDYNTSFLPFLSLFEAIPGFVFKLASAALLLSVLPPFLLKRYYRFSAFIAGGITLFFILSSKTIFSNSFTFVACLLLLIGLSRSNAYLYRIQISLLYFGAGINKLFTADWLDGAYIDNLLRNIYEVSLYSNVVQADQLFIAELIGMAVIVIELALAVSVLFPKLTQFTIYAGLLFHGGMLIVTSGELSLRFLYIMSAAFLLISGLKVEPIDVRYRFKFLNVISGLLDLTDTIKFKADKRNQFRVSIGKTVYKGKQAAGKLFLSKQIVILFWFYSILFILILPKILDRIS